MKFKELREKHNITPVWTRVGHNNGIPNTTDVIWIARNGIIEFKPSIEVQTHRRWAYADGFSMEDLDFWGRVDHYNEWISIQPNQKESPSTERRARFTIKALKRKMPETRNYQAYYYPTGNAIKLEESTPPMSWLTIGHYSKNVELWWRENGKIHLEKGYPGLTHPKLFNELDAGFKSDFVGRIDHDKKEVSVRAWTHKGMINDAKIKYIVRQISGIVGSGYKIWYFESEGAPELMNERFQRGVKTKHHINPSASDMIRFTENTIYKGIRLWDFKGDLYMWDAGLETHSNFFWQEFPEVYNESGAINYVMDGRTGHFYYTDNYSSHFGIDLLKNHEKTMMEFFDLIEEDYDIEWIQTGRRVRKDMKLRDKK